jgi:hypothetical protein
MNRAALIRYKTIDACLRDTSKRWTLADLMEACGRALHEMGNRGDKAISRRALQMDLELMRSAETGYNAPIVVKDKKYYTYEDPDFSILKKPLTAHDLAQINDLADLLSHFKDYDHFPECNAWVAQLRAKAAGQTLPPAVIPETTAAITLSEGGPVSTVEFYADADYAAQLVQTPLHPTQKVVSVRIDKRHLFSMEVVVDVQLEKLLLAQGELIEVMSPKPLRLKLGTRIWKAGRHY